MEEGKSVSHDLVECRNGLSLSLCSLSFSIFPILMQKPSTFKFCLKVTSKGEVCCAVGKSSRAELSVSKIQHKLIRLNHSVTVSSKYSDDIAGDLNFNLKHDV